MRSIEDLKPIISVVDVLYQTRVQHERFKNEREYQKYKSCYQINATTVNQMKAKSILMHPLPRVGEILTEVDVSHKAVYFKQVKYGLLIRMALLESLFT